MKQSKESTSNKHQPTTSNATSAHKYIIVASVLFFVLVLFLFVVSENKNTTNEDQDDSAIMEQQEPEAEGISSEGLLVTYIADAENQDLSNTERHQAYMNAAVLAADLQDDRAQSLAQEALKLFDEDSLNEPENEQVVALIRSIADGTYSPGAVQNIQVEDEQAE